MASALSLLLGLLGARDGTPVSDWDRRNVCYPTAFEHPASVAEVQSIVHASGGRGQIKVIGAGHSFSQCMLTDAPSAIMLNLDKMDAMLAQPTLMRPIVRVEAGMRLHRLNELLHPLGFALENLGAIAEQSVAGATQTSTHGTGRKLGSLSASLVSLTLVLANASTLNVSAAAHPDIFAAAAVGLGALGVVVEAEVRVVPSFKLRRTQMPWDLDALLGELPSLNERYERLQWFWTPNTPNATLLLREPVPPSTPVQSCWPNGDAASAAGPAGVEGRGHAVELDVANETCTDWSYKALCHPSAYDASRALYTEMEYFVPVDEAAALVDDLRDFHAAVAPNLTALCAPPDCSLFAGIRYVAADQNWLSMMYGES